ncbi:winged helix-turn-helix domain-containing protein [Methylobacter sp. sgz302048]|jgi:DNA-binding response OmpR family regulator|uniref:winged helix-turn-helix domain-containing protein n=1 Tax=Methylobacter sp. sgz302048 TaxID=3455945 RepID=UPI003F9F5440
MNANLQILFISTDHYYRGLLKGYCHAQQFTFLELADAVTINKEVFSNHLDLIILDMQWAVSSLKKEDWLVLQAMSFAHQIPVCALGDKDYSDALESKPDSWIEAFFDEQLIVEQLDGYLLKKFIQHAHVHSERRTQERRSTADRRASYRDASGHLLEAAQYEPMPKNGNGDHGTTVGPFQIDRRFKTVSLYGKNIDLTRKEFELFELLSRDVDRVLMAEEIIQHLWPGNNRATKSDLYQYMHLLRKKIEKDPDNPQWILTVKGFGYRLDVSSSAETKAPEENYDNLVAWPGTAIAPVAQ